MYVFLSFDFQKAFKLCQAMAFLAERAIAYVMQTKRYCQITSKFHYKLDQHKSLQDHIEAKRLTNQSYHHEPKSNEYTETPTDYWSCQHLNLKFIFANSIKASLRCTYHSSFRTTSRLYTLSSRAFKWVAFKSKYLSSTSNFSRKLTNGFHSRFIFRNRKTEKPKTVANYLSAIRFILKTYGPDIAVFPSVSLPVTNSTFFRIQRPRYHWRSVRDW